MNKLLYISIAILLLASCSKVKKSQNRIQGQWEIISYHQTDIAGFTEYYDAVGTITFGEDTDNTFTYVEDYTYQGPSGSVVVQREGIGTFTNDLGLDHKLDFTLPVAFTLNECTFRLLTKDDLKIEQRDIQFTHMLVLKND
ncbi:MAG: hypothetical protein HRT57_01770 [Crocinitomicaceae bacterium]|nr:hypothetical protein [Crocinitomicaceae bacterium]